MSNNPAPSYHCKRTSTSVILPQLFVLLLILSLQLCHAKRHDLSLQQQQQQQQQRQDHQQHQEHQHEEHHDSTTLLLVETGGANNSAVDSMPVQDHHVIQASWDGLFQGDLRFEHDDIGRSLMANENSNATNANTSNSGATRTTTRILNSADLKKWDDFKRNDYYFIRVFIDSAYTSNEQTIIRNALSTLQWTAKVIKVQYLASKPGINNGNSYLHIQKSNGCWSYYGRRSDANLGQPLSLDTACLNQRTIHHVFLHALGFGHEINRPDRDTYVSINYENIMTGYENEFAIMQDINTLGVPFDYKSAMMFSPNTFAKASWLNTIESKTKTAIDTTMDSASWFDFIQLRLMYQCTNGSGATTRTFAQYKNQKCNNNCQCWKKTSGCNGGGDSWCKGNLVCRQNVCVDP
eukprot:CAMPEP_0176485154 /NCGR_PEP_ID=MMETSP0200_2-20121128/4890_1 /TAXON_ID=947934 /ORGANISM="Chaetoceros sp., Strain GSL56" /LENGTH=406 /DNA_ID=CAMNT_0017881783 /DNA_START=167 /DNA_END=1387 /DNA_ORIENTATION=+